MAKNDVTACGITADNRPNVVIEDDEANKVSYWYHSTFYRVNDALDFLKDLYRDGISQDDLDSSLWLTLQELQEER
ncbi:hypothetical protein SAMN06313486_10174 [Epsilonproteobacteria bacterium SCGC AD-308-P11]|jgi:hypothetical protein|nr:hypothetical protein SAMN06313486_10174 [Epsilonproteobacteria bacterium SCGC AD-308-P11]